MRHTGWILSIILLPAFCFGKCNCNQNRKHVFQLPPIQAPAPVQTLVKAPVPVIKQTPVFSEGRLWVNKIVILYPEIVWLVDNQVRQTEEDQASADKSYSEQLYGQQFIEFDRSLMSLYCLKLILDGSDKAYQEFTAAQPENTRLNRESFQQLHEQGTSLLNSHYQELTPIQMQQVMETALVLRAMGKSEKARMIFKLHGVNAPDHDDFYGEAMGILKNHPRLSRSFMKLPFAAKQLLCKTANLAHYGHMTHLEGGPSMFTKLKNSDVAITDPTALSFDFFIHTCDVAGALGHVNNTSSIVYTEATHQALQATFNACRMLSDPTKTEADAYNGYLSVRASWLGLNPSDRDDRVLTRIAAMFRLFTPEEGAALKNAILQLSSLDRDRIVVVLGEEIGRTPIHMQTVLFNLYNNTDLGATSTERLSKAVIYGLPFIARVLVQQKQQIFQHQADPEIPLNFNQVAGVAKTVPQLLQKNRFQIHSDGTVTLR
jgi:hypothetical protein